MTPIPHILSFFFFNDTATTEIYTLSLHDALPIFQQIFLVEKLAAGPELEVSWLGTFERAVTVRELDRKSTRLNSSHQIISYAVFCLKKKKSRAVSPRRRGPTAPHACARTRSGASR